MIRQKLLVLYSRTPDLRDAIGAWAIYDGTGKEHHTTGDSEKPPYSSVLEAMKEGRDTSEIFKLQDALRIFWAIWRNRRAIRASRRRR